MMVISLKGWGRKSSLYWLPLFSSVFMFIICRKRNRCYRMPHVTLKSYTSVISLHINTTGFEDDKSTGAEELTVRYRKHSVTHTQSDTHTRHHSVGLLVN